MSNFFKKYSQVANDASGPISLGLIQAIAMVAGFAKVGNLVGVNHWIMWGIILLSSAGFIVSGFGIASVILGDENTSRWEKFIILLLFYPALIGILISAIVTAVGIVQ